MNIERPLLRYHGGKWLLGKWIISHFPAHRVYTETFGGAASVLLQKERSRAEIYNDLDGEVVNLFRVVRDPVQGRELVRQLQLTPFARAEFELSYLFSGDPIEQARRTIVRSFMGFSSTSVTGKWRTGFRANTTCSGTTTAHDWRNYPIALKQIIERLKGVIIENRPAVEILQKQDGRDALHYIDPPYPFSTRLGRWSGNSYRHEMSDGDHHELAGLLRNLRGMVIISGYPCKLYDQELYPDWQRVTRRAYADGASERVEVLWLSPRTTEALNRERLVFTQQILFSNEATQ